MPAKVVSTYRWMNACEGGGTEHQCAASNRKRRRGSANADTTDDDDDDFTAPTAFVPDMPNALTPATRATTTDASPDDDVSAHPAGCLGIAARAGTSRIY
mmetsp:Transcript_6484/g.21293  ORF Transcript_6484/g.21293 Transcript_6484/m.21293 type:complete len:100 (+) Transcript_6484:7923-8222(+)